MGNVPFEALKLEMGDIKTTTVKINETTELEVRNYLPIAEKGDLVTFVINGALDNMTGCFSPLRLEVYFGIAIVKWYAGVTFENQEVMDIGSIYDTLEANNVILSVMGAIPEEELEFVESLVKDTAEDIARYNTSFAGMLSAMSGNADSLDAQLTELLEKIKNKEGMELLSVIKDVGGTN